MTGKGMNKGFGRTLRKCGGILALSLMALCCLTTADALAAGGSDASKCTFKVQKKGGNRQKVEGDYSTTLKVSEVYQAEIRWRGEDSAQFTIETVYMVSENKRSFPYSTAVYYVTLSPNSTTNVTLETPEFVKKDYAYGSGYGVKFDGIIARLMKNGEILKVFTSKNDSNWKKIAAEKTIKTKGSSSFYGFGSENVQARLMRIQSGEAVPPGSPQKDISPAVFLADRPNKLVAFSAMASLSSDYYGDFYGLNDHYYCVSLILRKFGTQGDTSRYYSYEDSGSENRYVKAYVSRKSNLGQQVMNILRDGKRHDVNVNLHFPPARPNNSSCGYSSSTPCCYLDMMATNAVARAAVANGQVTRSDPAVPISSRRSRARVQAAAEVGSTQSADSSYEVDSFCGYKFGGDYRRSNQADGGGYSSSPDMVRVRLERPFRNFKYATLSHGKAGMQSVALFFYDETHAMKDADLEAEVVAVKGILEKKYGVMFNGSSAQRGMMLFSVYKSGNGIRLEATNRAVMRRGQNFGADGGADVL